jgi:hypothetical protein
MSFPAGTGHTGTREQPEGAVMGIVTMHNVVSVDGFIADANDGVGPLFDWLASGDVELVEGGTLKVSQTSARYVKPMWANIGSMVIGRHLFDLTNGWDGTPPAGEHVIVVSHRPRPDGWQPRDVHDGVHPGRAHQGRAGLRQHRPRRDVLPLDQVLAQWTGFARTGQPTAPNTPLWTPYAAAAAG